MIDKLRHIFQMRKKNEVLNIYKKQVQIYRVNVRWNIQGHLMPKLCERLDYEIIKPLKWYTN